MDFLGSSRRRPGSRAFQLDPGFHRGDGTKYSLEEVLVKFFIENRKKAGMMHFDIHANLKSNLKS
jgi:hypothetical protein